MILHSVTKSLGRGRRKQLVLDRVDWKIDRKSRIVVLGQKGAGKSTLLDTLSGSSTPTEGWVERRAMVSPRLPLTRFAQRFTTSRQLIEQHAHLYLTDPRDLLQFVEVFTSFGPAMDVPIRHLPKAARSSLQLALFYGIPFDFYLFDNKVSLGTGPIQQNVRSAFDERSRSSSMILATSSVKIARTFGGAGAVLHRGQLMVYDTVEEAIRTHEYLVANDPLQISNYWDDEPMDMDTEDD